MANTEFGMNSALAVKRWSNSLAVEAGKKQYFMKFIGTSNQSMIYAKTELQKSRGDKITMGMRMQLTGQGVNGNNILENTSAEESMTFFDDSLFIDQLRKAVKTPGKMDEQRVMYNMRTEARNALADWWAEYMDEQLSMYLSGARGVNTGFLEPTSFTGRANNSLTAPDTDHILYGGTATSKAGLTSSDGMAIGAVERLKLKVKTLKPKMVPLKVDGEDKWILLMSPYQVRDLRTSTTSNDWLDIQKNAGEKGKNNPIFSGALGEYSGVVLHENENVIRFDDYGSGSNLGAARALFLGAGAGLIAYGGESGEGRYNWYEEAYDRGNGLAVATGSIFGVKKTRFNSKDFGVIALDTYISTTI